MLGRCETPCNNIATYGVSQRRYRNIARYSGVAPADQTEESEVRELPGNESGTGSGTPFVLVNAMQTPKKRSRNKFQTPSRKVLEPHFLQLGLPEPLLRYEATKHPRFCSTWEKHLQGLISWAWLLKFCRSFGVLQNLSSTTLFTTLRSEIITQLTPQKLFRAMITPEFRAIQPEIILLKYCGAMSKWPLRKSTPGSMLQKQ